MKPFLNVKIVCEYLNVLYVIESKTLIHVKNNCDINHFSNYSCFWVHTFLLAHK